MTKHNWASYGTTEPHCGIPGKALGVPPHENAQKTEENVTAKRISKEKGKAMLSENIPGSNIPQRSGLGEAHLDLIVICRQCSVKVA